MQLTNDKMQGNRFELQRNAITLRSIEADEKEGKKMYKAIGKTFILSDAATLKNELTNRNKTLESEYAALQVLFFLFSLFSGKKTLEEFWAFEGYF